MKLTKIKLKEIIREELLKEGYIEIWKQASDYTKKNITHAIEEDLPKRISELFSDMLEAAGEELFEYNKDDVDDDGKMEDYVKRYQKLSKGKVKVIVKW